MSIEICRYLDTAVLKPDMTRNDAIDAIKEAVKYRSKTVCVRPCDIDIARELSEGSDTDVSVVLSFPHGCGLSEIKAAEAKAYIERGVREIDMVANYGFIRSGEWDLVESDIREVVNVCKPAGVLLKVILETTELNLDEVRKSTEVSIIAGADFVKTSTGFASGGASEDAVKMMLNTSDGRIMVKPSGGIRDYDRAKIFVDMGVHRLGIGVSSLKAICEGSGASGEGY